jgi:hypothetical protein
VQHRDYSKPKTCGGSTVQQLLQIRQNSILRILSRSEYPLGSKNVEGNAQTDLQPVQ